MRTAPVPNIPAIPGMNPGMFVAGGGAGGSGSDDSAGDAGKGKAGAGSENSSTDADGDSNGAPDPAKYPTCGTKSHPVDVVTGRAFTLPIEDLGLPGPLPFSFTRTYSTSAAKEDMGLGWGWAHSLGWRVEVRRRSVVVWNDQGKSIEFPQLPVGESTVGDFGWVLRREAWGYGVDVDDGTWRIFADAKDARGEVFLLSAIEDRNKNKVTLGYDQGRLAEIKDSAGRTIRVKSTKEGRIASLEVRNAETHGQWIPFATYRYDARGDLVAVTDADGHAWHYEYDDFHRLVKDKDRVGLTFHFRYDARDRCIESWGDYDGKPDPSLADDVPRLLADGITRAKGVHHCKFVYGQGKYSEVADSTRVDRFFGNARGMLDKAVSGTATTTSEYDDHGFQTSKTDAEGGTTRWIRDDRGRPLEVVDAIGRHMRITRDAYGLPLQVTDGEGGVWRADRDQAGNAMLVTDPLGGTKEYTRDARGLVTAVTNATGATTRYTNDAMGNVVEVLQANGGKWTLTYDAFGRRLSATDPSGAETRYAYSNRGDLLAVYDPTGAVTRYAYDGERHLVQVVSAAGRVTQLVWGGYNRLCGRRDAREGIVRLAYNREGELVSVRNERGAVHKLGYDPSGRLASETTFDGRLLRHRYDACGRLVRHVDGAGQTTSYVYDLAGQLIARELPDDTAESFEYNGRGELVEAKSAAGVFRFERDAVGRVVREVQTVGGVTHWVDVAFDAAGNRVGRATSLGHTEAITRDAMGARRETILDGEHRVLHGTDVMAREVSRTLAGGGVIESFFDPLGRLAQRRVRAESSALAVGAGEPAWIGRRDDGVTVAESFQYDEDGALVGRHDGARGVTTYAYDPIGQLLSAVPEKARAEVFTYDLAGNVHEGGGPQRAYDEGNRLLRRGDTDYVWDDDGRLTRKIEHAAGGDRVFEYEWNGAGLLASVKTPAGEVVRFAYDPFARRVSKTVHARAGGFAPRLVRSTRFVWDGSSLVHAVYGDGETKEATDADAATFSFEDSSFVPAMQRGVRAPAAKRAAEAGHDDDVGTARPWFSYVTDAGGAPERLVDDRGRIVCELERSAWAIEDGGEGRPAAGTPLRFQGQYEDEETGLYYNRARYYAPEMGRYISADPIELAGGLNLYAYARNPILGRDPSGLTDPDVSTAPNTAFFWSGRTNGVSSGSVVQDIAKAKGGTSLEMLLADRKIAMPEWDEKNPAVVKQWKDVSESYARGCSGTVHAVVGQDLRKDNVWEGKELPALKANPAVTKIVQIDPSTRAETVIFER